MKNWTLRLFVIMSVGFPMIAYFIIHPYLIFLVLLFPAYMVHLAFKDLKSQSFGDGIRQ